MNCHQGGDTRILEPGKDYFDFRPGVPLRQTLAIIRIPLKRGGASESDILEHHFSMQLSKCYRASRGRLSCLTCHKVHGMPRPEEAAAYYRDRCLTCHAEADCKLPKAQRLERADNCAGCHMPKRDVETIAHSALTNHRIVIRPGEPLPEEAFQQTTADLPDLVYLNRPAETNRASLPLITLLQAYGELMVKDPAYQPRYFAVLEELSRRTPDEPMVQAALGRKALQGDPALNDRAIDHLTRSIKLGFSAPAAYQDLAEALARAGREEDAVLTLQQGIKLAPYTPLLHKSLALRYIHLKQYAAARKALERYVELFPEDDFVRGLLLKAKNSDTSSRR
jgi:tetratricopeptide (TPR) repeat protein